MRLGLGLVAVTQLLAGLLFQLAVLRLVGAGSDSDAFVAAQTLPMALAALLSMVLQAVWQPRLAVAAADPVHWHRDHCEAHGQALLFMLPIAIVVLPMTAAWVPWLFPDLSLAQHQLIGEMSPPLFVAAALNLHGLVMLAAERARSRFYAAETASVAASLASLAGLLFLVPHFGIVAAAWVILFRSLLTALLLHRLSNSPTPSLRNAWRASSSWKQLRTLFAGSALQKSNPLVDRYWGAQAASPGITLLALAQGLITAAAAVMERMVNVPLAPRMARLVSRGELRAERRLYLKGLLQVLLMVLLVALMLVGFKTVWISALTQVLKLPQLHAELLWKLCLLLLPALLSGAAGPLVVAQFYSRGNTRLPGQIFSAGFITGLVFKAVGFLNWGLIGLVAAISLGHLFSLALLCLFAEFALRRQPSP